MLRLVRKDYGARVANLVAERLVLAPWRDAERSQRVVRSIPLGEPTRLARLMEWMRRNLRAHPFAGQHGQAGSAQPACCRARSWTRPACHRSTG